MPVGRSQGQSGMASAMVRERSADMSSRVEPSSGAIPQKRLYELACQMEDFLVAQIQRLEAQLRHGGNGVPPGQASEMAEQMEEERRRWQRERQREMDRLREDGARLAEAWRRVEREQRRLLSLQDAVATARSGDDRDRRNGASAVRGRYAAAAAEPEMVMAAVEGPVSEDQPLAPEVAVMQFQQLRREIQQHSQRQR